MNACQDWHVSTYSVHYLFFRLDLSGLFNSSNTKGYYSISYLYSNWTHTPTRQDLWNALVAITPCMLPCSSAVLHLGMEYIVWIVTSSEDKDIPIQADHNPKTMPSWNISGGCQIQRLSNRGDTVAFWMAGWRAWQDTMLYSGITTYKETKHHSGLGWVPDFHIHST